MEKWKPVKGYEGLYEVSDRGRIRSVDRFDRKGKFWAGRVMKQNTSNYGGYCRIKLCKDGDHRLRLVHRLVYEAFVGDIPDGLEINHIDENTQNNHVNNLEAVTHIENMRHGTGLARSAKARRNAPHRSHPVLMFSLDGEFLKRFPSMSEAARQTGASQGNIWMVCRGRVKTAGGYIWKYAQEENK